MALGSLPYMFFRGASGWFEYFTIVAIVLALGTPLWGWRAWPDKAKFAMDCTRCEPVEAQSVLMAGQVDGGANTQAPWSGLDQTGAAPTNTMAAPFAPPLMAQPVHDDIALVRRIVTVTLGITMLLATGYLVAVVMSDGAILLRPSELALERQEMYTDMVAIPDGLTGTGVTVCIVDSGIHMDHEDLADLELAGWRDFVNGRSEPYDDEGHGTAMAGILVAEGWMKGMAPDVDLLVAKALGSDGSGSDEVVAEAIDWCVEGGADIVSLSLGGAPGVLPFSFGGGRDSGEAASDAIDQGVLVVAAAGNDGEDPNDRDVAFPASEREVIAVGGVTHTGAHWSGSSKGENDGSLFPLPIILPRGDPDKKPEVVAPAEGVPVLTTDGAWGLADGTSAATVYVTGALALLVQHHPELKASDPTSNADTVQTVKRWLMDAAIPQEGQTGHDDQYGYGRLHMTALIERSDQT